MKGFNDMLLGTAEGAGEGAGGSVAEGGTAAADAKQGMGQSDNSFHQFANIDELFTSIYSTDGTYNQVLPLASLFIPLRPSATPSYP
jgi:hypothetical protein